MKQFISIVAALLFAATALAQSTNPLNCIPLISVVWIV